MSWSSRLGFGRFSPFGRYSEPPQVTDADFSYITPDDVERTPVRSSRPRRDSDVVLVRHRKISYPLHFPPYSIDDGAVTIGDLKQQAATQTGAGAPNKIKFFYKGRNLKDDGRACRDEGLRSDQQSEILCVVSEPPQRPAPATEDAEEEDEDSSSGSEDDDTRAAVRDLNEQAGGTTKKKKKKARANRKRKPKKTAASNTVSGTDTPNSIPSQPSRVPTPAPPQTPVQKLDTIARTFHTTLVPQCVQFAAHPPADAAKRSSEHKRLTETILQQILLQLDGVETDGDGEARARRKEVVREVQGMLGRLDEAVK